MARNWKDYQQEVAQFFRSLGLTATVEAQIEGARGVHAVDVWVEFSRYGFDIKWIVECKYWTSAVPKEKVLALHQIAQDVGADRAFLLSESGFQSGAINVARHTNITLTSLEDLQNNAQDEIIDSSIRKLIEKVAPLNSRIQNFMLDEEGHPFPFPTIDQDDIMSLAGPLFLLRLYAPQALIRDFPIPAPAKDNFQTVYCPDAVTFITIAEETLNELTNKVDILEARGRHEQQRSSLLQSKFVASVERLITNAEEALFSHSLDDPKFEELRLRSFEDMKAVGKTSDELKAIAHSSIQRKLRATMRILIDSVYLHLTQPTIPREAWEETKKIAASSIQELKPTSD